MSPSKPAASCTRAGRTAASTTLVLGRARALDVAGRGWRRLLARAHVGPDQAAALDRSSTGPQHALAVSELLLGAGRVGHRAAALR